ncbi:MAG: Fe-S cluster assembly protein SufD [Pseudomonadota bacterium]
MTMPAIDKLRSIVERLPTPREENWKYTDLASAREISVRWLDAGANTPDASAVERIAAITSAIPADWIVIANGRVQSTPTVAGLTISEADASPATDALAELNNALGNHTLHLQVNADIETPIGLLLIDDATDDAIVVSSDVTVEVAENCRCQFVEYRESSGGGDLYANCEVGLSIGDAANVGVVRIQQRGNDHVETTKFTATVGKDASFEMLAIDIGGRLVRNDTNVDLASPGAHADFNGIYLAGDGQHIDNHTRVDHRVGPATSRQEYRGILNGRCRCVWNGKAIVHEGADGTDAQQGNHNLLLSDHAEIDAKPELEIYADDVKCAHGTTVGQLDERSLFYLRTRGIEREKAKQMLTQAFAAALVSNCPIDGARDHVAAMVETRLGELVGEEIA